MERKVPLLSRKKNHFKENDLGFGSKVTESQKRLINKNGSFNTVKKGLPFWQQYSIYTWLISISWGRFLVTIFSAYFLVNLFFATVYWIIGIDGLVGIQAATDAGRFWEGFFLAPKPFLRLGTDVSVPWELPPAL